MKEKYYEITSLIIMSILLIILGIILLIGKNITYQYLITITTLIFWINSLRNIIKCIFRKKDKTKNIVLSIFHLIICIILTLIPKFILGILPFLFSIYLILIGLAQLIMIAIEIKNKEIINYTHTIITIICFIIAIPITISPVENLDKFVFYLSIYSILLGSNLLWESIIGIISKKTKNKLKRHIRITLPKIVEALIPYTIMSEINRNLSLEKKQIYSLDKLDETSDLDILIHTSNRGFNKMGHIDLYFEGKIFSYGNYNEGSRTFKDIFGDGVIFTTTKKEKYINFCIENSKKTVFDFGIKLKDNQKNEIKKQIKEIMKNTTKWDYKKDKKYNKGSSYAAKLYKKTKAQFYKFTKGKYKTYFVLGTNCCFLVDDIVGKSGMDILSINGIITPGTYYDYLNKELKLKNSNVISKEIYNKNRKANNEINNY